MKVSTSLVSLGLALGVVSEPISLAKRDLDTFLGVISDISDGTEALGEAIEGFSGDGDPVQSASDDLISTIESGVETVNGEEQLSSTDALQLTSPVQDLTEVVEGVIGSINSKKQEFIDADLGGVVKDSLQQQYDAADSLADAISSKVPEELSDIARQLSAGITDAIQVGIDEYEDVEGGEPTGSPTGSPTGEPTGSPTETDGPTDTSDPTSEPTSSPDPEDPEDPEEPSPSDDLPEPTGDVPSPSSPGDEAPPEFTGAAVRNKINGLGAVAIAAAIAAF